MGQPLTKLLLQGIRLTFETCRWKHSSGFRSNRHLQIKPCQLRHQMGWVALQSQFGEAHVQRQFSAELNGLQLLQLPAKQGLQHHQTER